MSRPSHSNGRVEHPRRLWRNPEPKAAYDAIVIGGGGHGLSTAYHLATQHGMTDVAVLERGWLGGGNMGRNTTVIRSNYLRDESAALYERSLQKWERLEDELEYDVLFDQRGLLHLAHDEAEIHERLRHVESNRVNGIDAEWLTTDEVAEFCPILNVSPDVRHPVLGATLQRRAGIAKHDHVAWAYARGADSRGVDIVQGCEVKAIQVRGGRAIGVETSRGTIAAPRIALAAAGRTSVLLDSVGLRLPIQSRLLQALVSDLHEQILDCVVQSTKVHVYVSQAQKGELVMGAGLDGYNSYAQRGSFHIVEHQMAAALELFPLFAQAQALRTWAGIVDVTPDASPIIGETEIEGLLVNCGWGTGGFKATPVAGEVYATAIATGEPHPLVRPFGAERFTTGAVIDEHGAMGVAH